MTTTNKRSHPRSGEAGNAFYLILIGVVLFGALMYSFSRNARQGQTGLTEKQADIIAGEIVSYGQRIERGVNRVILNGCSENDVSFETPNIAAYPANATAPVDNTCHVFHLSGGAVSPMAPERLAPDLTGLSIRPTGAASLENIGTWDAGDSDGHEDLVVWFGPISLDLCSRINRIIGIDGAPPVIANAEAFEYGPLVSGSRWGDEILTLGTLSGRMAGCAHASGAGAGTELATGYHYYQVLYAR